MAISLAKDANPHDQARRDRDLFRQRELYTWVHAPGQPPFCAGVPEGEEFTAAKKRQMAIDVVESLADAALATVTRLFHHNDTIKSFRRYYPIRKVPAVAERWTQNKEFGRQRLDGINPILIRQIDQIPHHFPVTDELISGLLPSGVTLGDLLLEGKLFLLDYQILSGLQPLIGRFCVCPMALFWVDEGGDLMPLAIQLGQSPAEAPLIYTPNDDYWLWLLARTFVQSADGTYHEIVAHLTRTHLVMETFWVAACRTLPPQHPLSVLLKPHFTGTVEINNDARTKLIAPGGPIDESIAIGCEGCLTLVGIEYEQWRFDVNEPRSDLQRRGVDDTSLLPKYHYRDDSLALYDVIYRYVNDLLRVFYRSDADVQGDQELQSWVRELVKADGGRVPGLPLVQGKLVAYRDLVAIVAQVIFSCSAEHAAVNNGQYAQFGWIPNTPGAMYLPPPTDRLPRNEANFVYALPDAYAVNQQLLLVHLLSQRTITPIGMYADDFFLENRAARMVVDGFRADLEETGRRIKTRNEALEAAGDVPYQYLEPWRIGRSIAI